jgi:hypothetical protein
MKCITIFLLEQAGAEAVSRKLESALGLVGGPFLRPLRQIRSKFDECRRKCTGNLQFQTSTRRRYCINKCQVVRLKAELAIVRRAGTRCRMASNPTRCQQLINQEDQRVQNQIQNIIERAKRLDQVATKQEYAEKTQRIVRGQA